MDKQITTLVGANEHGKSAILGALRYLDESIEFSNDGEYRIDSSANKHPPKITFYLLASKTDREAIFDRIQYLVAQKTESETEEAEIEVEVGEEDVDEEDVDVNEASKMKLGDIPDSIKLIRTPSSDDTEDWNFPDIHNWILIDAIHTTHSPFMIDRMKPERVRVVTKDDDNGTKIHTKGFTANWLPLRSALGMILSDSFYFADKTLIVEGPEDQIYISALLRLFSHRDSLEVDANLLSIISAGGAGNLVPMAQILSDEDRPFIVLIDSDDKHSKAKLQKIKEKGNQNIVDWREIKDLHSKALTIQDLLPKKIFEKAVNDSINQLIDDGHIKAKRDEKPIFEANDQPKIDETVNTFIDENLEQETISKVGIADQFGKIIAEEKFDYKKADWNDARKLVNWVVKELKLDA
jgi:predicted ATP-dependent endonuclease of OLD family